jgi:hypothetical protein
VPFEDALDLPGGRLPERNGKPVTKAADKTEKAKKPIKNVEPRPYLCGCGFAAKSRFLPGHDAPRQQNAKRKDDRTHTPPLSTDYQSMVPPSSGSKAW